MGGCRQLRVVRKAGDFISARVASAAAKVAPVPKKTIKGTQYVDAGGNPQNVGESAAHSDTPDADGRDDGCECKSFCCPNLYCAKTQRHKNNRNNDIQSCQSGAAAEKAHGDFFHGCLQNMPFLYLFQDKNDYSIVWVLEHHEFHYSAHHKGMSTAIRKLLQSVCIMHMGFHKEKRLHRYLCVRRQLICEIIRKHLQFIRHGDNMTCIVIWGKGGETMLYQSQRRGSRLLLQNGHQQVRKSRLKTMVKSGTFYRSRRRGKRTICPPSHQTD
jgi:hypothetical protein